jgi:hypothetical protein
MTPSRDVILCVMCKAAQRDGLMQLVCRVCLCLCELVCVFANVSVHEFASFGSLSVYVVSCLLVCSLIHGVQNRTLTSSVLHFHYNWIFEVVFGLISVACASLFFR